MLSAAAVVVCALELLGRTPHSAPHIMFLNSPPPGVSWNAEAFVVRNPDTIYLITSSRVFRDAMSVHNKDENLDAFRKIASIIVHEEWHLKNGPDERGAYLAQLTRLYALRADPRIITSVRLSMAAAVAAQKRRRPELLMARQ
jgi:hypothetical protein